MDLNTPLAHRVRPKTLDEFVGQEEILGKDKILYRTIKADRLSSIILWGPPGCGKTSLGRVISETTKATRAPIANQNIKNIGHIISPINSAAAIINQTIAIISPPLPNQCNKFR